jgi:hypothetical protein
MTTQPTCVGKTGYIKTIFYKPILWAFHKIVLCTQNIKDNFVRCGVRVASYLYVAAIFFGVMMYLVILAVMTVLMIVAIIIGLFLALLVLGAAFGGEGQHTVYDKHGNAIGHIKKD